MAKKNLVQVPESRTMVKIVQADNFFQDNDAEKLYNITIGLAFEPTEFGKQVAHFNLFTPGIEKTFRKVLHEDVVIDEDTSGTFRIPMLIPHFEGFDSIDEWCFAVALEDNVMFNVYHHLDPRQEQFGQVDAYTALDGYKFNYRNMMEWKYAANYELNRNQAIFFRPWMFHSFSGGLIHYYRLMPKKK